MTIKGWVQTIRKHALLAIAQQVISLRDYYPPSIADELETEPHLINPVDTQGEQDNIPMQMPNRD